VVEEAQVRRIGDPSALLFEVRWDTRAPNSLAWGRLVVRLRGEPLWHGSGQDGLEWTWIELLEHLGRSWRFIRYEQRFPGGLAPTDPRRLGDAQWLRARFGDDGVPDEELYVFQRRHDLASGVEGAFLPSLWLVRQGAQMWVSSEKAALVVRAEDVLETLTELGDAIAAKVDGADHPRAQAAVSAWAAREPSALVRLALTVGASVADLTLLVPDEDCLTPL